MSKHLLLNINNTQERMIHIIGIGGIGMSAIAEILHNSNYKVQGSDAQSNNNVDRLRKLGIEVYIGHNADNISQAQIVVHSSAIKSDNAELIAARNNNKTILHRSDILAGLLRDKYVIAVSGSSGKTTTTAMIASIFDHSGTDATVIVGGVLNSYRSNSRLGKSDIFLIEADESDGTMLKIPANIAVITSINDDHIDHYGTFDNIKNAFSQFVNKSDYAILPDSVGISHDRSITFGFGSGNIRASNIKQHSNNIEFDVLIDSCCMFQNNWIPASRTQLYEHCDTRDQKRCHPSAQTLENLTLNERARWLYNKNWIPVSSTGMTPVFFETTPASFPVASPPLSSHHSLSSQCLALGSRIIKNVVLSNAIGMHKVSNVLAAISVAIKLGISDAEIKKGLLEFKGVARRFSLIADIKGVKLVEDYAHHPNEIYATLTAARSITKGKVIGIIEPLRFARIRNFFDEFIRIFMILDYVILTPVHPPEDKPISGCGIDDIQKVLISNGFNNVKIMNDSLLISHFISDSTNSGDVVLFIGAGSNIAKLAKETAALMSEVEV